MPSRSPAAGTRHKRQVASSEKPAVIRRRTCPRKTRLSTLTGKKKWGAERIHRAVVRRQSAAGHDTVDVRVSLQSLSPGMQNAEETDLGAEVSGIGGNFQ